MTQTAETRRLKFLMNIVSVVTLAVVGYYYFALSKSENEKIIEKQEIICLTAVCVVNNGVGDQCFELQASLSLVSVTKDVNHNGGKRLILEPSLKSCGIGNGEKRNGFN